MLLELCTSLQPSCSMCTYFFTRAWEKHLLCKLLRLLLEKSLAFCLKMRTVLAKYPSSFLNIALERVKFILTKCRTHLGRVGEVESVAITSQHPLWWDLTEMREEQILQNATF